MWMIFFFWVSLTEKNIIHIDQILWQEKNKDIMGASAKNKIGQLGTTYFSNIKWTILKESICARSPQEKDLDHLCNQLYNMIKFACSIKLLHKSVTTINSHHQMNH